MEKGKEKTDVQRRDFLKKGMILSGGLAIGAPNILKGALANPSDKIKVGFIGLGKQHEVLFNAMKNIPGLEFVAVCDIMKYRVGTAYARIKNTFNNKPNRYFEAEEMLSKEKDMDAVVIATPDFWHAPHTVMALEAGFHVYCEKMMSNTIEGARSMVRAMEKSGKLCQIGHQRRSNPRYLYTLEELIKKQNLCGHIVNINGQWNRSISASQDLQVKASILPDMATLKKYGFKDQHQFLNWRWYKEKSGGPISDLGAHQIDIFNWFLDTQPTSVMASGGSNHFKSREHYDNVMCVFEYDTPQGGCRAFYQVLTTTSSGGGYYESFKGTEGTIDISERSAFTNIYRESTAKSWDSLVQKGYLKKVKDTAGGAGSDVIASYASAAPEKYALPGGLNKPPHQPHLENFFASIRGKETLNCDAKHAFESEAPIYWVNEAAETKSTIVFDESHLSV